MISYTHTQLNNLYRKNGFKSWYIQIPIIIKVETAKFISMYLKALNSHRTTPFFNLKFLIIEFVASNQMLSYRSLGCNRAVMRHLYMYYFYLCRVQRDHVSKGNSGVDSQGFYSIKPGSLKERIIFSCTLLKFHIKSFQVIVLLSNNEQPDSSCRIM